MRVLFRDLRRLAALGRAMNPTGDGLGEIEMVEVSPGVFKARSAPIDRLPPRLEQLEQTGRNVRRAFRKLRRDLEGIE